MNVDIYKETDKKTIDEINEEKIDEITTIEEEIDEETEDLKDEIDDKIIYNIIREGDDVEGTTMDPSKIKEAFKEGDYKKAIMTSIAFITSIFRSKNRAGYAELDRYKAALGFNGNIAEEKLKTYITKFSNSLTRKSSLSAKANLTHILSKAKIALFKKEHPEKQETNNLGYLQGILQQDEENGNPVIGKVILLNEDFGKGQGMHDRFNKATQITSGSRRHHAAIITGFDKTTGEITITHSVEGGVKKELLTTHMKEYSGTAELIICDPPSGYKDELADFAKNKIGNRFDKMGLVKDAAAGERTESEEKGNENDKYYCSELVFDGLTDSGYASLETYYTPGDLLNVLTPTYSCEIPTSEV